MSNTLAVRAVRSRTFLTPEGRYTVELTRPRRVRADSWAVVGWSVLFTNADKTRVTVARGDAEMPRDVALSTVDAMLRVMPDAWMHRVGAWQGEDGFDRLTRLSTWAQYRRDARYGAQSAQPGYQWGKHTPARAVRCAREAWARHCGWEVEPGYVDGAHLNPKPERNLAMSTPDLPPVNPFAFASPNTRDEDISFANALAYEWCYLDTCRELDVDPRKVPDGWAYAWLEYTRRHKSRMAIREAFRMWRDHHMLPNLDSEEIGK